MAQTSPRVLIIRLDAVGDALALTPLIAALHERSIPTDIVLTQRNFDTFAQRAVRERFVAPFALRESSRENLAEIASFGASLRERAYTHVLVATEDPGGYRLARAIGAPVRIGFANGWGKPFKTLWVRSQLTKVLYRSAGLDARAPHEVEVLFSMGSSLLAPHAKPTRDPRVLRPFVLDREPATRGGVAFQVTDKWERLGIAFNDVVACAQSIEAPRAIAAAHESAYADRFERAAGVRVERFDALEPWKEAIASSAALIAPDSGALHVAGMTGVPTVAIFPPQDRLKLQSARWAPWAAAYSILEANDGWPDRAGEAARALRRASN